MDAAASAAVGAARSLHRNLPPVRFWPGDRIIRCDFISGNLSRFRNSENMKVGNESVLAVGDGWKAADDGERDGIAEQAAQARLPVAVLFHAASLHVFAIPKT